MSPDNSPVVFDGYVVYQEVKVDGSAIMQNYINNEKKRIKVIAFWPFQIIFMWIFSWVILVLYLTFCFIFMVQRYLILFWVK